MYNRFLITRKHQADQIKESSTKCVTVLLENGNFMRYNKKFRNSNLKKSKETCHQPNAMNNYEFSFAIKDIIRSIAKI